VINVATALAERGVKIMPEILTLGGGATADGVGATLMKFLTERTGTSPASPASPASTPPVPVTPEPTQKQ
jgi:hypothetical protein